jgi:probable rRNA maturation factor
MPISVGKPPSFPAVTAPLRALITATLALEERRAGEISVLLSNDDVLRKLNRRWRGIDRATDVLSFGDEPERRLRGARRRGVKTAEPAVSGDLVISIDRLLDQAKRYRVSVGRELARLVIHGTLHLAGHDHHRVAERRDMRRSERRALTSAAREVKRLDRVLGSSRRSR